MNPAVRAIMLGGTELWNLQFETGHLENSRQSLNAVDILRDLDNTIIVHSDAKNFFPILWSLVLTPLGIKINVDVINSFSSVLPLSSNVK